MNYYRDSIIIFGIVLPLLVLGLLLGACYAAKANVADSFTNKQNLSKTFEVSRRKTAEIETKIVNQRGHLDRWNSLLEEESASAVNTHLSAIAKILPSKEYQKGGFDRTTGAAGLGAATAQRSSQIRLSFRGTFRTMQRAFLELETRMPQLQLQELRIVPNPVQQGQVPLLTFQVIYTAWEN